MEAVAANDRNAVVFMAVGSAIPLLSVFASPMMMIARFPDGQVGHIQISGENVTQGYYENPEANAVALTADGWLRTGDLGVVQEGELVHYRARQGDYSRQRPELLSHKISRASPNRRKASNSEKSSLRVCGCATHKRISSSSFVLHRTESAGFPADCGPGCAPHQ